MLDEAEISTNDLWDRIKKLPPKHQEHLWSLAKENGVRFNSDEEWVGIDQHRIMDEILKTVEEAF